MIYIISFANSGWGKVGVTESYLWSRFETLWTNIHPPALCCNLGCEHIEIIRVFAGSRAEEQVLFSLFPPDCGEFYLTSRLSQVIDLAEMMFEPVPAPAKPLHFAPRERSGHVVVEGSIRAIVVARCSSGLANFGSIWMMCIVRFVSSASVEKRSLLGILRGTSSVKLASARVGE